MSKTEEISKVEILKKNLEEVMYSNSHIHAGTDRNVAVKIWEKDDGQKRAYLSIKCYSNAGNFKGAYKCGYVDLVSGDYVCDKYDDVNAETKEYVGR